MAMDNDKPVFFANDILPQTVAELSLHLRFRSTKIEKLDNL